ncbi:pentapeptide repeat-containing protein (plasmid) [Rhodococcoides fascians A25f]|uniref:pentapeptide repeat-containing protein n=1 Tax=Rhodococcoides fascians TaxID=1828 RepID=UPI0013FDBA74|nr:pentapeptide repeat-containing protein [Rhodococcus fascians]QII09326.1 pentapeptide repeat-containing protein [Rhodococcus fascians A25f]
MAVVFLFLLWLQTGQPFHLWKFLSSAEPDQLFNAARTAATLLGVAGLGGAALIAYRRQTATETALVDERTKALHERYGAGAEQLGHNSAAIRLAGVYALASLADDWHAHRAGTRERQVCIDLLCAYLRSPAPDAGTGTGTGTEKDVRGAILDTIRRRVTTLIGAARWRRKPDWHTRRLNLRGADLGGADLSQSLLAHADFTTSNLTASNLSYSSFSYDLVEPDQFTADLQASFANRKIPPRRLRPRDHVTHATMVWTSFEMANLHGADLSATKPLWVTFNRANMRSADLTQAQLATSDFTAAILTGAAFDGAHLADYRSGDNPAPAARFVKATLVAASFRGAYVGHADFTGADLTGADFSEATGLEHATFTNAIYDKTTRWPAGYSPSRAAVQPHSRNDASER